jgi:hypothetical protein
VASDPAEFAKILRRCGGVDTVEAQTAQGFARLMDHFAVMSVMRVKNSPLGDRTAIPVCAGRGEGFTAYRSHPFPFIDTFQRLC